MHDFREYLDLARVFWSLDHDRIEAIATSPTAAPTFRDLSGYILELKAELGEAAADRDAEVAAITKVAVRLAGVPEKELVGALSGLPKRQTSGTRRKGWWRMIAGLIALLLIGLLASAGLAAAGVDLPAPVKAVLDTIGVPTALDPTDRGRAPGLAAVPPNVSAPPAEAPPSVAPGLPIAGENTNNAPTDAPRDGEWAHRADPGTEQRRRMQADPHGRFKWTRAAVETQRRPEPRSKSERAKPGNQKS